MTKRIEGEADLKHSVEHITVNEVQDGNMGEIKFDKPSPADGFNSIDDF